MRCALSSFLGKVRLHSRCSMLVLRRRSICLHHAYSRLREILICAKNRRTWRESKEGKVKELHIRRLMCLSIDSLKVGCRGIPSSRSNDGTARTLRTTSFGHHRFRYPLGGTFSGIFRETTSRVPRSSQILLYNG